MKCLKLFKKIILKKGDRWAKKLPASVVQGCFFYLTRTEKLIKATISKRLFWLQYPFKNVIYIDSQVYVNQTLRPWEGYDPRVEFNRKTTSLNSEFFFIF